MRNAEAKKAKQAEIDRKRAEVRKRMEEASKAKKAKKGFMTPDRKKKLRLLLRKKAAEELKKEQERKAAERRRIIEERCGKPKNIDDANEEQLKRVLQEYHARICNLEDLKWELEYAVKKKDFEDTANQERVADQYQCPLELGDIRYCRQLKSVCQDYYKRICDLESKKWDIEYEIKKKDMEVRLTQPYLLYRYASRLLTTGECSFIFPCTAKQLTYIRRELNTLQCAGSLNASVEFPTSTADLIFQNLAFTQHLHFLSLYC
ncbi:hypothetical protein FOCC_FOCC009495 [Frankliniella occidentalis]|nr:hypothetical protein FOCC_FOCC009495 [Frankliniella occidentalis]